MSAPFCGVSERQAEAFFAYSRERYRIFKRRSGGEPAPWTSDEILREHRFCNIFREDDRVTVWFRENVRGPMSEEEGVALATVAFRWFNRIETGERLLGADLFRRWDGKLARRALHGLKPLVTGSYMIKSPPGRTKLEGIVQCIEAVAQEERGWLVPGILRNRTLQGSHSLFKEFDYLGGFMAYEVVTDLRHTGLLRSAGDVSSWANFGPGAARGMGRICGVGKAAFSASSSKAQEVMCGLGSELLRMANEDSALWPSEWPRWEMREVEHTLCEWDKYERLRLGEASHIKRRFAPRPEGGGSQR